MPLPDFLIAGVPKAGTTAMHAALSRHPQLYLSPVKEPKFFLSDGVPRDFGGPGDVQTYQEHIWRRADYERLFVPAPRGSLRGEATPFYLYDLDAQRRIHRLIPDARIILLLRDPVDRAHSNWTHLWSAGLEPEADFLTACRLEPARRSAGWADFWHYVNLGRYGEQVSHLLDLFPREQVLFLRYRDLLYSPVETLDRACAFMGVRTGLLTEVPAENVSRNVVEDTPFNAALRGMLRFGGNVGHRFPLPVRKAFRGPLLTVLHRRKGRRKPLTRRERAALLPSFAEDLALLQEVTGVSYADWMTVDHRTRVG